MRGKVLAEGENCCLCGLLAVRVVLTRACDNASVRCVRGVHRDLCATVYHVREPAGLAGEH